MTRAVRQASLEDHRASYDDQGNSQSGDALAKDKRVIITRSHSQYPYIGSLGSERQGSKPTARVIHSSPYTLSVATAIDKVSDWTGTCPAHIESVLTARDPAHLYMRHEFPKGRGKRRIVHEPVDALMTIQKAVAARLQQVWKPTPWSHAFLPGRSIVTAATPHLGASWMLKFDMAGFFESIVLQKTFEALHKWVFPEDPAMAWTIAHLCSLNGALPQGAPASPILSDLVFHPLDLALQQLVGEFGCTYGRYADDVGISSEATLPKQIASESRRCEVGPPVVALVESFGFRIHPGKTLLTGPKQTHCYLGLHIVGNSLRVPRRFVRSVDGMTHAAEAHGLAAARAVHARQQRRRPRKNFIDVLRGKIEHIGFVQGRADSTYQGFLARFRALK